MNNNIKLTNSRILFFIEALNGGGAQRVLVNLTEALIKNGYKIALATNTDIKAAYSISDQIRVYNYREGCFTSGFVSKFHLYRKTRTLHNVRNIIKVVRPDVVVSFMAPMNVDVLLAAFGMRIPVICSEHTTIQRKASFYVKLGRKLLYKTASAITVLTKSDYKLWKPKMKNLVYMPNPSDPKSKENKLTKRNKFVLAAGRIDDWNVKGFDNLLRCWGRLCGEFPDWRLCIAGGGSTKSFETLQRITKQNGCENVDFLGFRSDINDLMSSSAVFCLSSRCEGLPMVLIEAMGAGCCCVAFDCVTGPSEIIKNKESGILVKNQDIDELTNKLRLVMSDDAFRQQLSSKAPQSVKQYSSSRILQRWMILFDKVI